VIPFAIMRHDDDDDTVPRVNPVYEEDKPIWPWLLGGAVVIGGIVLIARNASASQLPGAVTPAQQEVLNVAVRDLPPPVPASTPQTPIESAPQPEPPAVTPAPPPPVGAPPPPPVTAPPSGAAHLALVDLLRSSDSARRLFGFQAMLYSSGWTGNVPDGRMGPLTAGLIKEINRLAGDPVPTSGVFRGAATIDKFYAAWRASRAGATITWRLLPMTLPLDVKTLVNRAMITMYGSDAPLLQVRVA